MFKSLLKSWITRTCDIFHLKQLTSQSDHHFVEQNLHDMTFPQRTNLAGRAVLCLQDYAYTWENNTLTGHSTAVLRVYFDDCNDAACLNVNDFPSG